MRFAAIAALAFVVTTGHVAYAQAPSYQPPPLPMNLTAFAVNMSNIAPGRSSTVAITIKQWSPAAERERFMKALVEKGPNALLGELQDAPAKGRLRFPNWQGPDPHYAKLGWDLRYAWPSPLPEGGTRIVLAYDRYIGFWEARENTRTMDYPFTVVEIHLNKDGQGDGKMAVATKIQFDKSKQTLELENYSSEPVRLTTVKIDK